MEINKFKRCLEKLQLNNFPKKEEFYLRLVKELVQEYGQANTFTKGDLLKQLRQVDQIYFEQKGSPIAKQVLFFRHGKCSKRDKNYGLKPNTPVNEKALNAMHGSSHYSEDLLYSPNTSPQVIVSPLVRALQTCGRVLGNRKDNKPAISISPILAENSTAPSGSDVRTYAQFLEMGKKAPFRSMLNLTFTLSRIRYQLNRISNALGKLIGIEENKDEFEVIKNTRNTVIDDLISKSSEGISSGDKEDEAARDTGLTTEGKIEGIHALIQKGESKDLLLFGHGKNFKSYFTDTVGDSSDFDYGETRKLYLLENGKVISPPYKMCINQETGELEVQFTGTIREKDMKEKLMPEIPMKNPLTGLGGPQPDLSLEKQYEVQPEIATDPSDTPKPEVSIAEKEEEEVGEEISKFTP